MEIAEEQHYRPEEARLNLATPLNSEAKNYGGARSKIISRAKLTPLVPSTLSQEVMVPTYSGYSRLRWEQLLEDHAALLRD